MVGMSQPTADTAALAKVLGQDPPESFADLDQEIVDQLAATIDEAHQAQEVQLAEAIDQALRIVPWPLRRVVKKVILP